jgi:hypothetical protein
MAGDPIKALRDTETDELLVYSDRDPLSLSVRHFAFRGRKPDDHWRCVKVRHGSREVEMYVSPTGRSVRVFVDGSEVPDGR